MKNVKTLVLPDVALVLAFAVALVPELSVAAVPDSMTAALTGIRTDALSLLDSVIPIVAAIFGVMVLIKLFKRAGSKI